MFLSLLATGFSQAQWAIKESEVPDSNLEKLAGNKSVLVHTIPDKEWNASNFATERDLQWFRDARYGMFIHFGLSTYENKEISWGMISDRVKPDLASNNPGLHKKDVWSTFDKHLKLENFSKEELVDIIRKTGVKYLVFVAKHHDGFHLWDTQYSDFKSTNTPYGKDLLKEVIEACRTAGIKVVIYYSQRDWYHPDYYPLDFKNGKPAPGKPGTNGRDHQKYIDYQFNVVRELCTKYGKIDGFWFDAVYYRSMFTADMWDAEKLTRMIRELQPGILINNRTSLPGDYDTPEGRIGMFQNRRPWETCMTLCICS